MLMLTVGFAQCPVVIYLQVFTMQGSIMPSLLVLHVNVIKDRNVVDHVL